MVNWLHISCFLCSFMRLSCFTQRFEHYLTFRGLKASIDPFDEMKVSSTNNLHHPRNSNRPYVGNADNSSEPLSSLVSNISYVESPVFRSKVNNKKMSFSMDEITTEIERYEAKILDTLPLNVYRGFILLCQRYVERVAFIAFAVHIMVLIPFLRYLNQDLHVTVIPYIYYGPIVAMSPFIVLWLWLNNFVEVWLFDDLFTKYMSSQRNTAITKLQNEEEDMLEILRSSNSYDVEVLKSLSACRLCAKIDVSVLRDEVYALKGRYGLVKKARISTYRTNSLTEVQTGGAKTESANTVTAVKLLLGEAETRGLSSEETLEELRQLQSDLNNMKTT